MKHTIHNQGLFSESEVGNQVILFDNEVEIGILNRETKEIFTAPTEKDDQIYFSVGESIYEEELVIYGFESNVELFRLKDTASDATINREFLKKFKILKPGAVKRYRKEGLL